METQTRVSSLRRYVTIPKRSLGLSASFGTALGSHGSHLRLRTEKQSSAEIFPTSTAHWLFDDVRRLQVHHLPSGRPKILELRSATLNTPLLPCLPSASGRRCSISSKLCRLAEAL